MNSNGDSDSEKIKLCFEGSELEIEARIGDSILELAQAHEVDLDHACGGVCACASCHVKILSGIEAFNEASEDEEDQLDEARGVDLHSRLGCQARIQKPPGDGVILVSIPRWNVNLAREG